MSFAPDLGQERVEKKGECTLLVHVIELEVTNKKLSAANIEKSMIEMLKLLWLRKNVLSLYSHVPSAVKYAGGARRLHKHQRFLVARAELRVT
jgi:hypothetical protein